MTYICTDNRLGVQPFAEVSTTQNHPLGTIVRAYDADRGGAEFVYVKGVTNGAVGSWAHYSADDGSTTLAVANGFGPLCVFMAALDASTDYGWAQISGKASGLCLTGFVDNADVYLTGTNGSVDDTDVAGDYVFNALGASDRNTTTGLADFDIARPFTTDNKED